jgi:GNAT superfamily N-acetyltransferase
MVEIVRNHLNYHHGQHDFVLKAHDGGDLDTCIGYLAYREYEGQPSVGHIFVDPARRNQRIGSQLVLALQAFYPTHCIEFGGTTDDGSGLLASLDWTVVPNRVYEDAQKEHSEITAKLKSYAARHEALITQSQAVKDAFLVEVQDWNDLWDRQDELERIIRSEPAEFRYVAAAKPIAAALTI